MTDSGKVPLPQHMYTKPVDVNQPVAFGKPKATGTISYEPLEWNMFFDRYETMDDRVPIYHAGKEGHVFVCLHGAGHSAMSFAALAKHLKLTSTVVAFDFRGHGKHFSENDTDLSEATLVMDTIEVIRYISVQYPDRSIIMVGHSMGGSIATKATAKITNDHAAEQWAKQIQGLFVIDVVEGSAMDALPFMENIVLSRPPEFKSLASVVQYGIRSASVKDLESARISMPDQVIAKTNEQIGQVKYVWRTDLMATKPYWEEWFKGLTQCFLSVRVPK